MAPLRTWPVKEIGKERAISGCPILFPASVEKALIDPRNDVDPDALAVSSLKRDRCVTLSRTAAESERSSNTAVAVDEYSSGCVRAVIVHDRPEWLVEEGADTVGLAGSIDAPGVVLPLVQAAVRKNAINFEHLVSISESISGKDANPLQKASQRVGAFQTIGL